MSNMNNITTELGVEKFPVGGRIGVAIGIMAAVSDSLNIPLDLG